MYVVHNASPKTVVLPDLHAQIEPNTIVDLEKIADRETIDRSVHLRIALRQKRLRLGRHSVVRSKQVHVMSAQPQVVQQPPPQLSEEQLTHIIRRVVNEIKTDDSKTNVGDAVEQAVRRSVGDLVSEIRDKINSVPTVEHKTESSIDPTKLAELSQKSVEKLSTEIETTVTKRPKAVTFINTDLKNRANEL